MQDPSLSQSLYLGQGASVARGTEPSKSDPLPTSTTPPALLPSTSAKPREGRGQLPPPLPPPFLSCRKSLLNPLSPNTHPSLPHLRNQSRVTSPYSPISPAALHHHLGQISIIPLSVSEKNKKIKKIQVWDTACAFLKTFLKVFPTKTYRLYPGPRLFDQRRENNKPMR